MKQPSHIQKKRKENILRNGKRWHGMLALKAMMATVRDKTTRELNGKGTRKGRKNQQ